MGNIRANDNLPEDIAFSVQYLSTGGLGEVVMVTDQAYRDKEPRVQSTPDMILALCILAQEAVEARKRKAETDGIGVTEGIAFDRVVRDRERMAREWSDFCAEIGVDVDTHEVVADFVQSQAATIAELQESLRMQKSWDFPADIQNISVRLETVEAQLKVAREALQPFADKSKAFDDAADKMGFARAFDEYHPKTNFTHGDLRRARAALSQQAPE